MTKSPAPALTRGLEIIELLATEKEPVGFNQLMESMSLSASSLSRYLQVLVRKGYLRKDGRTGYSLGLQLLALSHSSGGMWDSLLHYASPILRDTTNKYCVTLLLVGFSGRQMVILDKVLCPNNISGQEVGEVKTDYLWVPWGAMFLAHASERERAYMLGHMELADNRMGRAMSEQELAQHMQVSTSRGYVDDGGTLVPRVRRLAAPVYGPRRQLIAALAAVSLTTFLEDGVAKELIAWLKDKAAQLSNLLQVGG
jgi:DNA-binding IclR family transcriptional regulator